MSAEERQSKILAAVDARRSMSVADLQRQFDVTRETIRRDLLLLEKTGRLRRMHGGAVSLGGRSLETTESDLAVRRKENAEGKQAIGRMVAGMIPDGTAIILGFGTTVEAVAENLAAHRGLTVVTNSILNCLKLSGRGGNQIHMLGGALQATNQATLGVDAAEMLAKYYAKFVVLSVGTISRQGDIMEYTLEEAELCRRMLRAAETSIVVADRTGFGGVASVRVESLEKVDYLVTDAAPQPAFAEVLKRLPVKVLVADTPR